MTIATKLDKSADRVQQMFGEIAPRYDCMNHLLSMQVDRYWRRRAVQLVPPSNQQPILDICTGTGDLAFAYHRSSQGHVPIVAADFCRPMLARGEMKKRQRGLNGQVVFVQADAQDLPFDDDHFQVVCVAFGLRNVANTERGLREMARVTAPGGKIAILEFSQPTAWPFNAIYGWYFRHVLPRIGQLLAHNNQAAYKYLPESVEEFPQGTALVAQLCAVGLVEVFFRPLTWGIATLYVGTK